VGVNVPRLRVRTQPELKVGAKARERVAFPCDDRACAHVFSPSFSTNREAMMPRHTTKKGLTRPRPGSNMQAGRRGKRAKPDSTPTTRKGR
jgi:hypothetical protein